MRRIQSVILGMALIIPCSFSYATNVLGLDLGISEIQNLGNTASFPLGYSTFQYTPNNTTKDPSRFGAYVAKQFSLSSLNALQIGVSYHYITTMSVNGTLEQGISPPFVPFSYSYSLHSSQLLAEGKWVHQWREAYYPYAAAGIGAGFNHAQNYATNIPDFMTLTPYYSNHSSTSFSYSLGLGLDYALTKSITAGLGYRFSDLGHFALGNGAIRNILVTSPLSQSHLYLNTLLIELNWYI